MPSLTGFKFHKVIAHYSLLPRDAFNPPTKLDMYRCNLCTRYTHSKHTTSLAKHLLQCPSRAQYERNHGPLDLGDEPSVSSLQTAAAIRSINSVDRAVGSGEEGWDGVAETPGGNRVGRSPSEEDEGAEFSLLGESRRGGDGRRSNHGRRSGGIGGATAAAAADTIVVDSPSSKRPRLDPTLINHTNHTSSSPSAPGHRSGITSVGGSGSGSNNVNEHAATSTALALAGISSQLGTLVSLQTQLVKVAEERAKEHEDDLEIRRQDLALARERFEFEKKEAERKRGENLMAERLAKLEDMFRESRERTDRQFIQLMGVVKGKGGGGGDV